MKAAIVLILCWNGDNAPWKDTASSGWEAIGQWFAKPETLKAFAVTGISILLVLVLTSILKAISKGIGVKNKKAATIFSIIRSLLKWIAIFVAIFVVDGRRNDVVLHRENANHGFNSTSGTQQVTSH